MTTLLLTVGFISLGLAILLVLALTSHDLTMKARHVLATARWNELDADELIESDARARTRREGLIAHLNRELNSCKNWGSLDQQLERLTPLREQSWGGPLDRARAIRELGESVGRLSALVREQKHEPPGAETRDAQTILSFVLADPTSSGDGVESKLVQGKVPHRALFELLSAAIFMLHYETRSGR